VQSSVPLLAGWTLEGGQRFGNIGCRYRKCFEMFVFEIRASCIAGPCPFTQIDSSGFAAGGRTITASALDWADTATFLLEAEVFHDNIDSSERESYPVVFDRTLDFTLPPTQEGVSIEAEINGTPMVFPLGPDLYLSWADCTARSNGRERSQRCISASLNQIIGSDSHRTRHQVVVRN